MVAGLPRKAEIVIYVGVEKDLLPISQIGVLKYVYAKVIILLAKLVDADLSRRENVVQYFGEQYHFGHLPDADGASLLSVDLVKSLREKMLGHEIPKSAVLLDI